MNEQAKEKKANRFGRGRGGGETRGVDLQWGIVIHSQSKKKGSLGNNR